jgi:hypothetical protein
VVRKEVGKNNDFAPEFYLAKLRFKGIKNSIK